MLRIFFSAIVLFGTLGFLTWYALQHLADLPELAWQESAFWSNAVVAFLWYNVAAVVTAANWRCLLRSLGDRSRIGVAESVFLMTQAAKYLPGNVAHLIGRVAVAKTRGFSVSVVSASLLSEQILVILAATLFIALGYLLVPEALYPLSPYLPATPLVAALLLGAALIPLFLGSIAGWIGRWAWMPTQLRSSLLELQNLGLFRVLGLIAVYCVAFFVLGVVVVEIANAVSGALSLDVSAAAVVFTGAWVVGFLMPGAPAGIGVRETIIVVGLAPLVGEGAALTIALAMRLVSVVGDASSFLIGFAGDRLLHRGRVMGNS